MEQIWDLISVETVLWFIFLFTTVVYLLYYFVLLMRLGHYKAPVVKENNLALSVIICAKNEAENLQKNLPAVLLQDYPDFEVIVVNDGSWDKTEDILQAFQKEHPHLKLSYTNSLDNDLMPGGKKFAQTIGIKAAANEWMVFTDADCRPLSDQWLKHMSSKMQGEQEIVLAYGPYEKKKGFLNQLIRFDTFHVALQ